MHIHSQIMHGLTSTAFETEDLRPVWTGPLLWVGTWKGFRVFPYRWLDPVRAYRIYPRWTLTLSPLNLPRIGCGHPKLGCGGPLNLHLPMRSRWPTLSTHTLQGKIHEPKNRPPGPLTPLTTIVINIIITLYRYVSPCFKLTTTSPFFLSFFLCSTVIEAEAEALVTHFLAFVYVLPVACDCNKAPVNCFSCLRIAWAAWTCTTYSWRLYSTPN